MASENKKEEVAYYSGEPIYQSRRKLSLSEQERLLNWHPLLTGYCPECQAEIPHALMQTDWQCQQCDWRLVDQQRENTVMASRIVSGSGVSA